MGVPGISVQELRDIAVSPADRTPSHGAPDQTPQEAAAPAKTIAAGRGGTTRPAEQLLDDGTGVRLRFDEGTQRVIAQIVDKDNKVVRQIPPEDVLRIAAKTRELLGLLFDHTA